MKEKLHEGLLSLVIRESERMIPIIIQAKQTLVQDIRDIRDAVNVI